jgi:acrylyl-CoA reductase (NADPH)
MTHPHDTFRAFLVDHGQGDAKRSLSELSLDDLGEGDVAIRVDWSGINYKDALASTANGKVARLTTLVPGIDCAGSIVDPGTCGLAAGSEVIVHGYDLGVAHHGGFSEYARVPAQWVVPLPTGLSTREAMSLGTAGFTAALSITRLEQHGLQPDQGPVLVTGATGGVGSVAVGILAARGYEVIASTGKQAAEAWLRALGAAEVVSRESTSQADKPLQREHWAAAVDSVGGSTLAYALSTLRYGAAVAASGNTGGIAVSTTVFPFILRGVTLYGIDSVQCDLAARTAVWNRLAGDLRPRGLDSLATNETTLDGLSDALDRVHAGNNQGRTVVRLR